MSGERIHRARQVAASLPEGGLFHDKSWRVSPDPFPLDSALVQRLEKLGRQLAAFSMACDQLYRLSADGRQPGWIAGLLDRGKPPELVALQRERRFNNVVPRVIRPDLVLTDYGFVIAELDSVPGGIGLTAWLNETYEHLGAPVLGGAEGMLEGFESIFAGGDIAVSAEASDYRPEMEWLAGRLNRLRGETRWRVTGTERREAWPGAVYRFFELFDLANVECWEDLAGRAREGLTMVTPPFKPALEEKLWFALFWLKPLLPFWTRALGGRTLRALQEMIPYTWLVDPSPLPPHAVLPRLEVHDWDEVKALSQKGRDLILKVSGFSPVAWGSRGVVAGFDVSAKAWGDAIDAALADWHTSPHLLQQFHHARLVEHDYLHSSGDRLETLNGRVRLCPYYFTADGNKVLLGGALATICPSDKKLLHGMPEAILAPAGVGKAP